MKIILVRHAETGIQYKGRYIGSTNLAISDKGVQQSKELSHRLKGYGAVRCLASPMLRTRQTAKLVWGTPDSAWGHDDLLKEIDFGHWEGKSFAEISQEYPKDVEKWAVEGEHFCFPGGEKTGDFWSRIDKCAAHLTDLPESPLLVITHGGVIRSLICSFLGLSYEKYLLFDVQPGRFAVVDVFSNGGILSGLNL